jgi:hypothetical protein
MPKSASRASPVPLVEPRQPAERDHGAGRGRSRAALARSWATTSRGGVTGLMQPRWVPRPSTASRWTARPSATSYLNRPPISGRAGRPAGRPPRPSSSRWPDRGTWEARVRRVWEGAPARWRLRPPRAARAARRGGRAPAAAVLERRTHALVVILVAPVRRTRRGSPVAPGDARTPSPRWHGMRGRGPGRPRSARAQASDLVSSRRPTAASAAGVSVGLPIRARWWPWARASLPGAYTRGASASGRRTAPASSSTWARAR